MCLLSYTQLLSWKLRCIILVLKANEAHLKPNGGVLPVFGVFHSERGILPFPASWDTAPRLMPRERKEEFTNSESILWSLLCWPPGNLHRARKVKSAQAIKLVKDSSVSGITFH